MARSFAEYGWLRRRCCERLSGTGSNTGSGNDREVNNLNELHGIWYNYASAYDATMPGKPHTDGKFDCATCAKLL